MNPDKNRFKVACGSALIIVAILLWNGIAFGDDMDDAVQNDDLAKAKVLITNNPALVASTNSYGLTPLIEASMRGYRDISELLLTNKADVNAKDGSGKTSLHLAVAEGDRAMAELLITNNADINATDD